MLGLLREGYRFGVQARGSPSSVPPIATSTQRFPLQAGPLVSREKTRPHVIKSSGKTNKRCMIRAGEGPANQTGTTFSATQSKGACSEQGDGGSQSETYHALAHKQKRHD